MDFISNQEIQIKSMLDEIGISYIEELFKDIPSHLRLQPSLQDDGMSEYEGMQLMEKIASKNTFPNFLQKTISRTLRSAGDPSTSIRSIKR
jgi:glycine dehydrogenase subunit 1